MFALAALAIALLALILFTMFKDQILYRLFAPEGAPPLEWPEPSPPKTAQQEAGKRIFMQQCDTCHGRGTERPATLLIWGRNQGEVPGPLELRTDLAPESTKYFVRNGTKWMPQFRKTEITDEEVDALAAYLARNVKN